MLLQIVTTHKGTDFDGLASLLAATVIYPDALPVLPGYVNPNLKNFLAIHKDLFNLYSPKEIDINEVTSLVVVDTNSWRRLEGMEALRDKEGLEIILWDHHGPGDIRSDYEVREEVGATVSLLIREIETQRKLITPIQATLFLMGIYEDTGFLSFPSTLATDAHAAAFLLDRKADLNILNTFLKQAYGKKQKDILFDMLQKATRDTINDFSVSICKMEVEGRVQNLNMVVQMYREIVNVDAAFGIFKDIESNKCMVIARSAADELNIGLIMRSLGGGGHPGAGSAMLKNVKLQTIEETIVEMIRGNQHSSVMLSDIMSYPVVTVSEDTAVEEVANLLREIGCTGIPVVDKDERLVGMISRKDFKKIRKDRQMQSPVKAFMSRDVKTISHTKSAMEAARLMIRYDIGRIPVMDDDDAIIGIVTRSDTMLYFYDLLPD
jgi:nanoRNase/pAp phosphatase (c-di-AMP/oligoRNAs hydrolase)